MPWRKGKEADTGESSVTQEATAVGRFGNFLNTIRYGSSKRSTTPSEDEEAAGESSSDNCPQLKLPFAPTPESAYTKRKPVNTLNSLISNLNVPNDTDASFGIVQAGYQDGDRTQDGSNPVCVVGILPYRHICPALISCPRTIQSFEEDREANGWDKKRLDEQLSVVARLMNTMSSNIDPVYDFGFRKNGITTEATRLCSHAGKMVNPPWGAVMKATEDVPGWIRGVVHQFPGDQFDRISRDYFDQVHRKLTKRIHESIVSGPTSEEKAGEVSLPNDMPLVEDKPKSLNSGNKLIVTNGEFNSHWFSQSGKDEYVLDFRHTANQPEVYTSRLSSVDNRETTPEDEERFNRNIEPLLQPLSIMLNEGVSNIQYHCGTKDGYTIKVEELSDGSRYWKATLVDQRSGGPAKSNNKTFA